MTQFPGVRRSLGLYLAAHAIVLPFVVAVLVFTGPVGLAVAFAAVLPLTALACVAAAAWAFGFWYIARRGSADPTRRLFLVSGGAAALIAVALGAWNGADLGAVGVGGAILAAIGAVTGSVARRLLRAGFGRPGEMHVATG